MSRITIVKPSAQVARAIHSLAQMAEENSCGCGDADNGEPITYRGHRRGCGVAISSTDFRRVREWLLECGLISADDL